MGASAKVTTNAPAIPDTRVMMFPLLVLEMKERGERHKGSDGSAQNLQRSRHVTIENLPKLHGGSVVAGAVSTPFGAGWLLAGGGQKL
jgi:hypothetical protein